MAVLLFVLTCFAVDRVTSIAALQNALARDWEISFNGDGGDRPPALPQWLDDAAESLIRRTIGAEPERPFVSQRLNQDTIWQVRFRALFHGPIKDIEIFYPGRLRNDLGGALARFSSLRRLAIHEPAFSDSDWAYVFRGLHRLRHLEELEIGGHDLRDSTIAPLAGQASLRKVRITLGKVGTESIDTFSKLPHLSNLALDASAIDDGHEWREPVLPEIQQMFKKGLPHVTIQF